MKKTFRTAAFALSAATLLALSSCGDTTKTETTTTAAADAATDTAMVSTDSARMGKPEGVMVDGVAMTPDKSIIQNAVQAASVSTLIKAISAADLGGTLSGPGPFTVFAPTNSAFISLPKGALDGLMKPESKEKLKGVLTYHVIAGRLLAADLKDGQELTTVNGEKVKVAVKDGKVMINNATVQIADVVSSNGITHVIDQVLLPSAPAQ
ncbi:Uncaracterized surface protein containing fasciclin (FAS1) repeats [Hymenobacter daecheongensis DSM 21074]|uniref:Uncaracterized surface protein containing fasciclin (FAS1) repeats n=1 Tax=Hymenobacter daecheongensis DSM 21074 TaxID=1121955 RepID=A0A1M6E6B3_9BACT|nr:fasciclin domain-containing protein [Hymenobacter daecheongensis]SHI80955.1 Uncaracterized surface protein containing fasciclin (FAS1) repeats [Hymenobacter daecheongensis DSM 21074]